jgi:hypothetical protein
MIVKDNADTTTGTIVGADGAVLNRPTVILSQEEADLLRRYKKFLQKRGLREALYCTTCWTGDLADGVSEAYVTDAQILLKCNHRMLFYQGQSF